LIGPQLDGTAIAAAGSGPCQCRYRICGSGPLGDGKNRALFMIHSYVYSEKARYLQTSGNPRGLATARI
jgi:hypothetical protein